LAVTAKGSAQEGKDGCVLLDRKQTPISRHRARAVTIDRQDDVANLAEAGVKYEVVKDRDSVGGAEIIRKSGQIGGDRRI
jgi:hypothetical protein